MRDSFVGQPAPQATVAIQSPVGRTNAKTKTWNGGRSGRVSRLVTCDIGALRWKPLPNKRVQLAGATK